MDAQHALAQLRIQAHGVAGDNPTLPQALQPFDYRRPCDSKLARQRSGRQARILPQQAEQLAVFVVELNISSHDLVKIT
jgi:hypothetical protein